MFVVRSIEGMILSVDEMLVELKARQDIRDNLSRYCRGVDRCDASLMASCFHDDAIDDHGFFKGPASEFVALAVTRLSERFVSTKHHVTTHSVELRGRYALCETYILALSRLSRDGEFSDVTFSARYLDRFECRNGQWKVTHRRLVSDGRRTDPVGEDPPDADPAPVGARGNSDPSVDFFNSF